MRFPVLTLYGTRGIRDSVPIVFATVSQALRYLHEINEQRRVSGVGPARATLTMISRDTSGNPA